MNKNAFEVWSCFGGFSCDWRLRITCRIKEKVCNGVLGTLATLVNFAIFLTFFQKQESCQFGDFRPFTVQKYGKFLKKNSNGENVISGIFKWRYSAVFMQLVCKINSVLVNIFKA